LEQPVLNAVAAISTIDPAVRVDGLKKRWFIVMDFLREN
jgi:hypothetical protein